MLTTIKNKVKSIVKKDSFSDPGFDNISMLNERIAYLEQSQPVQYPVQHSVQQPLQNNYSIQIQRLSLELAKATQLVMRNSSYLQAMFSHQKKLTDKINDYENRFKAVEATLRILDRDLQSGKKPITKLALYAEGLRNEISEMKKDRTALDIRKLKEFENRVESLELGKKELFDLCEKSRNIFKSINAREEEMKYIEGNIQEKLSSFVARDELTLVEDALRVKIENIKKQLE